MQKESESAKKVVVELRKLLKKCGPQKYSVKTSSGLIVEIKRIPGKWGINCIQFDALNTLHDYVKAKDYLWLVSSDGTIAISPNMSGFK